MTFVTTPSLLLNSDNPKISRIPIPHAIKQHVLYEKNLKASVEKVIVLKNHKEPSLSGSRNDREKGVRFESSVGGTQHQKTQEFLKRGKRTEFIDQRNLITDGHGRGEKRSEYGTNWFERRRKEGGKDDEVDSRSADGNGSNVSSLAVDAKALDNKAEEGFRIIITFEIKEIQQNSMEVTIKHAENCSRIYIAILPDTLPMPTSSEITAASFNGNYAENGFVLVQSINKAVASKERRKSMAKAVNSSSTSLAFPSFTFQSLRSNTKYKIYACGELVSTEGVSTLSSESDIGTNFMSFSTLVENYNIDWTSLDDPQREAEVMAAVKCKLVQKSALLNRIPLPSIDSIQGAFSKRGFRGSAALEGFVNWWIGGKFTGGAKHRHDFLMQEILYIMLSNHYETTLIELGIFTKEEYQLLAAALRDSFVLNWLPFYHYSVNKDYVNFSSRFQLRNIVKASLAFGLGKKKIAPKEAEEDAEFSHERDEDIVVSFQEGVNVCVEEVRHSMPTDPVETSSPSSSLLQAEGSVSKLSATSDCKIAIDSGSQESEKEEAVSKRKLEEARAIIGPLYLRLRSWFKGGDTAALACKNKRSAKVKASGILGGDDKHMESEENREDWSFRSVARKMLEERTGLLRARLALYAECEKLILSLVSSYTYESIIIIYIIQYSFSNAYF